MPINPLAIIPKYESSNCTDNHTSLSTSSGCFGFLDSTWKTYAGGAGVDTAKYPSAADAPTSVQFAVAAYTINKNGLKDWTCAGCDAKFVAYVEANGGLSNFSTSGLSTNPADYSSLDTSSGRSSFFSEFGVGGTGDDGGLTFGDGSTITIEGTGGQAALASVSSQAGVLARPFTWAYDKLIKNTQAIVSAEIQQTQTMVATYIAPFLILALVVIGIRVMRGH